jgi:NAD-dependent histone deacetylase SIR2
MGQEHSALISDDTPPQALSARTLEAVADYIKSGKARRIVVMTGAGISTAAGSTCQDRTKSHVTVPDISLTN